MKTILIKIASCLIAAVLFTGLASFVISGTACASDTRRADDFSKNWKFHLGDVVNGQAILFDDAQWRALDVPHDWSIEGEFNKDNPATVGGGALPGGIGWYRKSFSVPAADKDKLVFIEFDGVYRNSEVWINGHYLGKRPYGYITFQYEMTPFLKFGGEHNVVAVKVDNSQQPNSRWYSGSGIYRNVRLVTVDPVHVDHWGTYVTTPEVTPRSAKVSIKIRTRNSSEQDQALTVRTVIIDGDGKKAGEAESKTTSRKMSVSEVSEELTVANPVVWTLDSPRMYTAVTTIECNGKICDEYETPFGIRTFNFDVDKGFSLNGKSMKINGVCDHHDLGCLGSAVNKRALERQLEILKGMGCNAIRTSHNPPAPELLDLCDRMGFIVMDEAFDMWKEKKTEFDYSLDWDTWHKQDLTDMILRDRNHPSVFIWSIGNEIVEQWDRQDSSGIAIARELGGIVRSLDTTRPITSALNNPVPSNPLYRSGALDLVGNNYNIDKYPDFPKNFPGKKFIATETVSALATRGHYDMPSDSIRRWPTRWDVPFNGGNVDNTCSAYDNCSAPWGSTQEETWKVIKKYDFLSGQFIWTGFDYIGEPTPYGWPSRSSYFGIIDLAGFPKDVYYMYQSEWTNKPMLHIFPHWNWKKGDTVDVWAYSNCDEVELFLNGKSLGAKRKAGDELHLVWRVPFVPGTLKAVSRTGGKEMLTQEIRTAGAPAMVVLEADHRMIAADGKDLSFITVKIVDQAGVLVPNADNLVHFTVSGEGRIAGVDNGLETSHESFKAHERKAYNGLCLAVLQSTDKAGTITVRATSDGLTESSIAIDSK
ncbi:MAG TPA: beta-galactosidase GalB [Bacteroidota bacterium]|nr:beta-galactosidase GalB [Bacteroidota bacterium]